MAKNKIWIIVIVALIVIISLIFILQNKFAINQTNNTNQVNNTPPKITIKIATNTSMSAPAFPLFVAQEKGFFSENGLDVQLIPIVSSNAKMLLDKNIDYSYFVKEAVAASLKDAPIKVIMTYGKNPGFAMVTQPNLKISKIKKIVITTLFSPSHYTALKFINDNKLSAEVIEAEKNPGSILAILKNKKADAVIQPLMQAIQFKNLGYTLLKTFDDEEMPQGLATTDEKIQNNPEEIKKVIKSIQSALEFIANNPGETKDLFLKFINLLRKNDETDQKIVVEEAYPAIKKLFTLGNVPSQDGINNLIKLGKAEVYKTFQDIAKQTVSEADIAKSFDFRFVTNGE